MRAVLLLNPLKPATLGIETAKDGPRFADRSVGFDFHGDPKDDAALAARLRELADALTAPAVPDPEFF